MVIELVLAERKENRRIYQSLCLGKFWALNAYSRQIPLPQLPEQSVLSPATVTGPQQVIWIHGTKENEKGPGRRKRVTTWPVHMHKPQEAGRSLQLLTNTLTVPRVWAHSSVLGLSLLSERAEIKHVKQH